MAEVGTKMIEQATLFAIHYSCTIDTRSKLEEALSLPSWRHHVCSHRSWDRLALEEPIVVAPDGGRTHTWAAPFADGAWLTFTFHQCSGFPASRRFGWQRRPRGEGWILRGNRGGPDYRRRSASWTVRKEVFPSSANGTPHSVPVVTLYYHLDQYIIGIESPKAMELRHFPYCDGDASLFRGEERGTWIAFAVVYGFSFISYWLLRWWDL